METLNYVRKAVCGYVDDSGVCEDDPRVIEGINEARRLLYPLGDWRNITEPFAIKAFCGNITLPAGYDYAKTAFICCRPVTVVNDWFSHLPGDFNSYCGQPLGRITRAAGEFAGFRDWPNDELRSQCTTCAAPEGFYMQVIIEDDRDCGTEITFQGIGRTRMQVSLTRTLNEGPYKRNMPQPGEDKLIHLQRAVKPKTYGRIRIYGRDGANTILLAVYDPDEINPQYARYSVGTRSGCVVVKAKKKFVPYDDIDTQFVDIHTDALIHTLQAVTSRKNRNIPEYEANMKLATGFLNRELQGEQSTSTSPIKMSHAYKIEGLIP